MSLRPPTGRDVYQLLRQLKKLDEPPKEGDEGFPHPVVHRAKNEGFVFVRNDFGYRIYILSAGEKFLRQWPWRWWRYAALVGGLLVTMDSACSLKDHVLGEPVLEDRTEPSTRDGVTSF